MSETANDRQVDVVVLVARRWRTVAILAFAGVAASVAYAYLAPEWYEATLRVVPSQRSQDAAAMSLAARLPSALNPLPTDVQRIQAVLTSDSVTDEVIDKFSLQERYETKHREHARKALWQHCWTVVDRKSGVVSLTCEDTDPEQARAMAGSFGEIGNRVFGRVSASSAREERKFLETQVTKARSDVDEASRKLRDFQEKHKVVDLTEQSKAVISAMASIKGELLSKQLELSYLSSFSARTESSVVQLQQQIGIMKAKLKQLEDSQYLPDPAKAAATSPAASTQPDEKNADFFPGAMTVPALRFELEQLMREQKIQETIFGLMTQRYEMARIDEARDTSTFQILDHPTLPTYRSRPKRKKIVIAGLAGGLMLAAVLILLPVWWRRRLVAKP
jgi:capsule polysaccharide export protein KpsE/RkpR